jgi:hypothetical protein
MQCPVTNFDCITCDGACLLQRRREQNDPFRRGQDMRTCDAEVERLGLEKFVLTCNAHERVYEDGSGYICRHCGIDMDDED